ncbi:50S ribosomal protein L25 [Candidatus Dojkabacteria bacterium]|nr:50S ribosomal protein L25 [Candidatus Dojkabacteria bacterium]
MKIAIKAEKRDKVGKQSKKLAAQDQLPAVVYNSKGDSTSIKLDKGEADREIPNVTTTSIVEIKLGEKTLKTILKEVQREPVTDEIIHLSFFEVDPKKKMVFEIPFRPQGVAPAVKNNIGILVQIVDTIEVKCTVDQLIPEVVADVTHLEKPGDTIRVNELDIPEEIELLREEDHRLTVFTITHLQKVIEVEEEEPEEGEEEEGEEGEEGKEGPQSEEGTEGESGQEAEEADSEKGQDQ